MTKVDKLNFKFNLDLGGVSDSEDDDTKTEKTTARSEKIENDEPPPKPKKDKEKSKLSIKTLKDPSKFVTIGGMLSLHVHVCLVELNVMNLNLYTVCRC